MKPETALGLISASEGFSVTRENDGCYTVEEKDLGNEHEHILSASVTIEDGEVSVRYWIDGVYNNGTDFVEIPTERFFKLKRLCEFLIDTE